MRRALFFCLVALLATAARAELSAEGDAWDDLSRWLDGQRQAGGQVIAGDRVDLGAVPPGSGLALLSPGPVADPAGLRRFVQEGGRVLLAIEDADADALLRTFETQAAAAPATGGERLEGRAALVILRPPQGLVFEGVSALVTNHPAGFAPIGVLEPAVRFHDGTPFAWHLRLGEGELLLLGDASLFINLMLDAGDNGRFAANTLAWLSRGGAQPVTVVGGGVPLDGTYGAPAPEESGLDGLNRSLAELGGTGAPDALLIQVLLALLLAATTAYTLLVFPGRQARRPGPGRPAADSGPAERAAGRPGGPAAPETPSRERSAS
ncbi:MAG: hypothetical protein H6706_26670 [Myxococcales bacterium]|nr:hypothetical protein [Myxococcales bacterium]